MPARSETSSRTKSAALDPGRISLCDLVTKEHSLQGVRALREERSAFAGMFVFDDQEIALMDDIYGEPVPEYPEAVAAIARRVQDERLECFTYADDGSLVVGHPIWLYYNDESFLKGCFVVVTPQVQESQIGTLRAITEFVADLYSQRASAAFNYRVEHHNCEILERELKLGNSQLASVIHGMGAALILVDRDMRIVWHNALVAEQFGPDLRGKFCHEAIRGRREPCDECVVRRTFETGHGQVGPHTHDSPELGKRLFRITTAPVLDEAGRVKQVLGLIYDTTESGGAESELARYKKLVNGADDFMVISDEDGCILAVNRKVTAELGYAGEELIGKGCTFLLPDHEAQRAVELRDSARSLGMSMDALHLKKKDGTLIPTHAFVNYDRELGVLAIIFRDISERLRMEEEIGRRSREVHAQNQKVRAAAEEKSRFFRNVSHELRTPLTSIVGFSEILLEDSDEPLTESQRAKLEKVSGNAQRLLLLINDLLDLGKIEADRMTMVANDVKLDRFLARLASDVMPLARHKNLTLDVRVPQNLPEITTDEQKLGRIVINLVSNAIKFTPQGGVTISAKKNDKFVAVAVRDTGTGIPAGELEDIFREFYQGSNNGSEHQGTGLGLPIARELAQLLGGRIDVESEVGVGSTFTLSLPLKPRTQEAES